MVVAAVDAAPVGEDQVLASAWCFSGKRGVKVLSSLSDQQSRGGLERAGVDSCFLGDWLCGSLRFEKWRRALQKIGVEVQKSELSGRHYRFGSGVLTAVATWAVPVQVGEMTEVVVVDVVRGGLPLLLGQVAMEQFRLAVDGSCRQVTQRLGSTVRVLDGFDKGQLPSVSILPGHGCEAVVAYSAWVAKGDSASTVAGTDEQRSVSAVEEPLEVDAGGAFGSDAELEELEAGAFRMARKTVKPKQREASAVRGKRAASRPGCAWLVTRKMKQLQRCSNQTGKL